MKSTLVALGFAALGCATAPDFDIGGSWTFSESFSSSAVTCTATGELLISHESGSGLFGGIATRGATCDGAPAGFDPGGADAIIQAEISGSNVQFTIDLCQYEGTTSSSTAMSGTMTCEIGVGGQVAAFAGTWQALRA